MNYVMILGKQVIALRKEREWKSCQTKKWKISKFQYGEKSETENTEGKAVKGKI